MNWSPRGLFFIKSRIRRRRLNLLNPDNVLDINVSRQMRRHRRGMFGKFNKTGGTVR
jgi:hypothetical protein